MTEIVPNLHWIKGLWSNIYLWVDDAGLVLFDTGMSWDQNRILDYVRKIGRIPTDIKTIAITHPDINHAGCVAAIQEVSGAIVYSSRQTADYLKEGKSPPHMPGWVQFIIDRFMKYRPLPASAIHTVEEGESMPGLDDWQVIASPGHTLDHHSFFNQREGILIAGDALDTRKNQLNCTREQISADMKAARHSARRLLRLTPAVIACGHGTPMQGHEASEIVKLDRELAAAQKTAGE